MVVEYIKNSIYKTRLTQIYIILIEFLQTLMTKRSKLLNCFQQHIVNKNLLNVSSVILQTIQ